MTCYMKGNQRVVVLLLNNCKVGDFVDRCWNVATYKWKVRNWKILIISFVVKFRS
jgi:hypothetical protein